MVDSSSPLHGGVGAPSPWVGDGVDDECASPLKDMTPPSVEVFDMTEREMDEVSSEEVSYDEFLAWLDGFCDEGDFWHSMPIHESETRTLKEFESDTMMNGLLATKVSQSGCHTCGAHAPPRRV